MGLRKPILFRVLIHLILVAGGLAFALPFLWMLGTSMMVEKEVFGESGIKLMPSAPEPRLRSPYINTRQWDGLLPPDGLSEGAWQIWRPTVRNLVHTRLAELSFDWPECGTPAEVREECIEGVWDEIRRRIPVEVLERQDVEGLVRRISREVTTDLAEQKLTACRRGFALGDIRVVHRRDRRETNLTRDLTEQQFAEWWRPVTGSVELTSAAQDGDRCIELRYDLRHATAATVIADLELPTGPDGLGDDVKAIKIAYRPDETWHRLTVRLEAGGVLYETVRPSYLGSDLWSELIVQPPSREDDDPVRVKTWTVIEPIAHSREHDLGPDRVRLSVTLDRSSPSQAMLGKAARNFRLAGRSVPFWRYTATSIALVTLNIVLTIFSSSLVAYAFARLDWPGRDTLFLVLLGTMMIPPQVTMIPGFVIVKSLGWYNTLTPLWAFAAFGTAFNIFLLRQFMRSIPRDLEEAARIDGCGFLRVWWHVMMPLVKPTLAAIAIFTFIGSWNDFLGPLIYVNDPRLYPLALGLFALQSVFPPQPMPVLMAASFLMTVPIIAIFFFAQKYFIQGVTLTGMKG